MALLYPYEKLKITWSPDRTFFNLHLPWLKMEIDVKAEEQDWITNATTYLHNNPEHPDVQRFLRDLQDYPMTYYKPRTLVDFNLEFLEACPGDMPFDLSTPQTLYDTMGLDLTQGTEQALRHDLIHTWTWEEKQILAKAKIADSDLYDPLSFVSYLICYRLNWESTTWSGQAGLGNLLTSYLQTDEPKFFRLLALITRQSWQVTMDSGQIMKVALEHFPNAEEQLMHFIMDEAGHYKFMDQVFEDLELKREDFQVTPATTWLLASHSRMAKSSPLAFSAMINLFEAAFYEGEDPISRVVKHSSKPHAARGYDLHYKINQEHRHCDMPLVLAQKLAPQSKDHLRLTLKVFELTLNFLEAMEKKLDTYLQ